VRHRQRHRLRHLSFRTDESVALHGLMGVGRDEREYLPVGGIRRTIRDSAMGQVNSGAEEGLETDLYIEIFNMSLPSKSVTTIPLREIAMWTLCSFFLPALVTLIIFLTASVLMLSPVIFSTTVLPKETTYSALPCILGCLPT
jgi:hypothetical protein